METHQTKTEKTTFRDLFLRTIAVLGLIAILLLGAWGIIQLAFALPTVFGNLGDSISSLFTTSNTTTTTAPVTKETITVTAPSTLGSGQSLELSWMHSNSNTTAQYSYAISYACESGLTVKAPLPTGSYQTVPCNTAFNYVNASEHMIVIPTVTGASQPLTLTVTATMLSTGQITASGSATTNITSSSGAAVTTNPAPAAQTSTYTAPATTSTSPAVAYYPAATPAATLYGYGDLAVTITSVAPSAGLTTVKFTIANVGTNVVNSGWTFNASLPINGSYSFGSQPQQALYPGDKIAYTLSFNAGTPSTTQYPYSTTYPYALPSSYGYSTTGTTGYSTSGYTCNGYTCNNNYVTTSPYNTQPSYGYGYGYGYPTGTITIDADPNNYIPEYNKNNNIAQTTVPLY